MVLTSRVAIQSTRGSRATNDLWYSGSQPFVSGPPIGAGLSTKSVFFSHDKCYRNDLSDADNMLGHKYSFICRVRNYWLSWTPKNTVGKNIFKQGFPTGNPVKSMSWNVSVFGKGTAKETQYFFAFPLPDLWILLCEVTCVWPHDSPASQTLSCQSQVWK